MRAARRAHHRHRPLDGLHQLNKRRQIIAPVRNQDGEALVRIGHARAHELIAPTRDDAPRLNPDPSIPARQQDDGADGLCRLDEHSLHAARLDGCHGGLGLGVEGGGEEKQGQTGDEGEAHGYGSRS